MTAFFFVLNLVLLFRLLAFFLDDRLSRNEALGAVIVLPAILFVFFEPSVALVGLQAGLVTTIGLSWLGDRYQPRTPVRLGVLLIQVVVVAFSTSPGFGLAFRPQVQHALNTWPRYFSPLAIMVGLAESRAQAYLTGLLVCIQEANLLVRWIIESLGLRPARAGLDAGSEAAAEPGSSHEYNRGRVIGTLERIAVYVLVVQGQYDALGLVLAAKGLARFQNLDDREFAEYFLIGTFLSVILAGAVALAVKTIPPP
jgi:hypothetical protein